MKFAIRVTSKLGRPGWTTCIFHGKKTRWEHTKLRSIVLYYSDQTSPNDPKTLKLLISPLRLTYPQSFIKNAPQVEELLSRHEHTDKQGICKLVEFNLFEMTWRVQVQVYTKQMPNLLHRPTSDGWHASSKWDGIK